MLQATMWSSEELAKVALLDQAQCLHQDDGNVSEVLSQTSLDVRLLHCVSSERLHRHESIKQAVDVMQEVRHEFTEKDGWIEVDRRSNSFHTPARHLDSSWSRLPQTKLRSPICSQLDLQRISNTISDMLIKLFLLTLDVHRCKDSPRRYVSTCIARLQTHKDLCHISAFLQTTLMTSN